MRSASLVAFALLAACGGDGLSGDMTLPRDLAQEAIDLQSRLDLAIPPTGANVMPMYVDGFQGVIDVPYVTVEVCVPGTTTCTTVDHIIVDTGSTGTHILASALGNDLLSALPRAAPLIGECYTYAGGYVFGSVTKADLKLGAEVAAETPLLIMADPAISKVPNDCQTSGVEINSVDSFHANGIIGIGHFPNDCGTDCALASKLGRTNPAYYDCTDPTACSPTTRAVADQLPNPVSKLPVDNNGVILELPAVPEAGAVSATGYLVFGIGTQDNNALGDADVYPLSAAQTGWFLITYYKGKQFRAGFFDSGSSALFLPDDTLPSCQGLACPPSTVQLSAAMTDFKSKPHTIDFRVTNGMTLLDSGHFAADDWAFVEPSQGVSSFDVGLPFFFGRKMFSAISGAPTPIGPGPFYAVY